MKLKAENFSLAYITFLFQQNILLLLLPKLKAKRGYFLLQGIHGMLGYPPFVRLYKKHKSQIGHYFRMTYSNIKPRI